MDTPNNHQNTYINAEKVHPKEGVVSPLLFIFIEKLFPGLRPERLISEFIAVETAVLRKVISSMLMPYRLLITYPKKSLCV